MKVIVEKCFQDDLDQLLMKTSIALKHLFACEIALGFVHDDNKAISRQEIFTRPESTKDLLKVLRNHCSPWQTRVFTKEIFVSKKLLCLLKISTLTFYVEF